jgi:hypothetical protein
MDLSVAIGTKQNAFVRLSPIGPFFYSHPLYRLSYRGMEPNILRHFYQNPAIRSIWFLIGLH